MSEIVLPRKLLKSALLNDKVRPLIAELYKPFECGIEMWDSMIRSDIFKSVMLEIVSIVYSVETRNRMRVFFQTKQETEEYNAEINCIEKLSDTPFWIDENFNEKEKR